MGKSYAVNRHKYWSCPFFKWDGRTDISCEGGKIKFPDTGTANGYMNAFCAGEWEKCTIAAALYKAEEENM